MRKLFVTPLARILWLASFFKSHRLRKTILYFVIAYTIVGSIWGFDIANEIAVNVLLMALQLAYMLGIMIFQFIGLFWFLASGKVTEILPGDPQTVTLDDYWGQPALLEIAKQWSQILAEHESLRAMGGEPPRGVLLIGEPGTGKCVSKDTTVITESGLVPIGDMHPGRQHDRAYSFELEVADGFGGTSSTSHFYCGGRNATVKLETARGYGLECTPEHPLMVMEPSGHAVWKRADSIKVGEFVALASGSEIWGSDDIASETA